MAKKAELLVLVVSTIVCYMCHEFSDGPLPLWYHLDTHNFSFYAQYYSTTVTIMCWAVNKTIHKDAQTHLEN